MSSFLTYSRLVRTYSSDSSCSGYATSFEAYATNYCLIYGNDQALATCDAYSGLFAFLLLFLLYFFNNSFKKSGFGTMAESCSGTGTSIPLNCSTNSYATTRYMCGGSNAVYTNRPSNRPTTRAPTNTARPSTRYPTFTAYVAKTGAPTVAGFTYLPTLANVVQFSQTQVCIILCVILHISSFF
jgi:hypothetical protein